MNSKDLYLRLLGYVRPHLRFFALSLACTVLLAATEPLLAALIKPLLDGSFVDKDPQLITWMPVVLVVLFLVRGLSAFAGEVAMKWVAHRVVMDLRAALFQRLLTLPTRYFDQHPSGALLSKITYDTLQVMNATTQALVTLVRDSLATAGLLAWMFWLNWRLSLMVFLIGPAIALVVRIVARRLRRLSRTLQLAMGELTHVVEETLQGHKVIKIFGGQDHESRRFQQVNNKVRRFNMKLAVAAEASSPLVQLLVVMALAVVVYTASLQSAANEITVGGFVSLLGAMAMLLAPIKRLTRLNEHIQRGLAAAESIFTLLDEPPEPDTGRGRLERVRGEVRFEGVGFRYGKDDGEVLQAVDLTVAPGETIALVGPSGSGKTTLMGLLPRFYETSHGRVRVDGTDIAKLSLRELRARIAYVSQDIVLFNDTVAANIAYGAPRPVDTTAVLQAAENAHALEFIHELPQGLETPIGANGVRLSGGQRQRLAIARALYKDAPILILDEATSALDTQSERKIQEALETLRQGRTAFIIAHRLSTIENADRIVVLNKGRIAEMGNHRELLELGGLYAGLYRMQAGE